MAQTFNGGPLTASVANSLEIRQNQESFLTNNAGISLPGYAEEGMPWYDSVLKRLHIVKLYPSLPYGEYMMGSVINLGFALEQPGEDGSGVLTTVRIRTSASMSGADKAWDFVAGSPSGGVLDVGFNTSYKPSYFAAKVWDDAVIGEPALWTSDGRLSDKNWETIPTGYDDLLYTTSPSVLSGGEPSTTKRAVDIELRDDGVKWRFVAGSLVDHVVFPLVNMDWWEVQSAIRSLSLVRYELLENGIVREDVTFKVVPFVWGGVVQVVIYNVDPANEILTLFNTQSYYELRIRKDR